MEEVTNFVLSDQFVINSIKAFDMKREERYYMKMKKLNVAI